jgi:adenine/guanine phosphoribosyltransferase-like PRPP-binding protein
MNICSPNYKRNKIKMLKDYLLIIIGSIITAAGMNVFLIPNKIAPGGVSGIATVIYHLSGGTMPVGIVMLALNIPLFVMGKYGYALHSDHSIPNTVHYETYKYFIEKGLELGTYK